MFSVTVSLMIRAVGKTSVFCAAAVVACANPEALIMRNHTATANLGRGWT
jgi:hypothetical protein